MVLKHQNQLAKCPNSTSSPQRVLNIKHTSVTIGKNAQIALALANGKVAHAHTSGLTWSQNSSAYPKCSFPFHQEKALSWQPVLSTGETGRILETNNFGRFQERPPNPLLVVKQPQAANTYTVMATTLPWKTQENHESSGASSSQSHAGRQICYLKDICGVRLLATQKPIHRPGWWKGKLALFQLLAPGGGGSRHQSKA